MLSIAFTGDISFSAKFKDAWKGEFIDAQIVDFLNNADYVVANVESPFTNKAINSARRLNHVSSTDAVEQLIKMNANVWNLANNHILDCGKEGALDTIELARLNNCKSLGVGKNLEEAAKPLIIGNDEKVGIISVVKPWGHIKNSGMAMTWNNEAFIKEQISKLKKSVKWIVLVVHGGDEFSNIPMPWIRKQYLCFLEWGADIIVGHHPHVVQNYEIIGDKIIFYSLGNFIFDTDYQRSFKYTENGILLKLNFSDDKVKWDFISTKVEREYQKVVIGKKPEIFSNIDEKNYNLLWPVGAKQFVKNEDYKKRTFLPQYMKLSDREWKIHKIKRYRHKRDLLLLVGCVLCDVGIGRFSKLKNVYEYLCT